MTERDVNGVRGPKVLFIVGKGRSGSTLLDVVLGAVEGFLSLGEVWVWKGRGNLDEQRCGCGSRVGECPVWKPALRMARKRWALDHGSPLKQDEAVGWQEEVARWRGVLRALRTRPESAEAWPALHRWSRFAGLLYRALAESTGARVLIDSSKWPGNPGPLGLVPGIRPYVVHLVRDPRAVTHSWRRVKAWEPEGRPMSRFGPLYSSVSWVARNALAGQVLGRGRCPHLRVRYEDFVTRPGEVVRTVFEMIGEDASSLPLRGERTIDLLQNHTAMGNASRFRTGLVELRADDEWKEAQSAWDRLVVTGSTLPLLLRYGYPVLGVRRGAGRGGGGS